jgi:hypothetical protein
MKNINTNSLFWPPLFLHSHFHVHLFTCYLSLYTKMSQYLVLSLLSLVSAHRGCGGGEIMKRNPGGEILESRQAAVTWQQEAQLSGDASCVGYSYAPWSAISSEVRDITSSDNSTPQFGKQPVSLAETPKP